MEGAIVYHWKNAFPGREMMSLDLKRATDETMNKAKSDGVITDFAWYFTTNGDLNYLIVRGEMENLVAFTADPEVMFHHTKCGMTNEGFTWSLCVTGPMAETAVDMYAAAAALMP